MIRPIFLLFSFFLLLSCDDDDDNNCSGIDCLPPATTTGEGTFGCLVNGEPYVDNSGRFNCFYQLVDGEYYFVIGSRGNLGSLQQMILASNSQEVIIGPRIPLNEDIAGEFYSEIS